jgi:hypothetical protein
MSLLLLFQFSLASSGCCCFCWHVVVVVVVVVFVFICILHFVVHCGGMLCCTLFFVCLSFSLSLCFLYPLSVVDQSAADCAYERYCVC